MLLTLVFLPYKYYKLQVLKSFMTDPLSIVFDAFSIWLLGYKIEFNGITKVL